ncbi:MULTISPECIES: hypothetical protein [unclassified Massilia]|uniref:hypothetical protein n=1 Tax=unclassified Massilia TaxID=2609279 RepID=UPI001B824C78|nr:MULTISPECIES: hypothetical protein [unclassified Massilia]MBQ5939527.1 hypothetical protein [Massilia sp. AB1]MBQ5962010.1 hypothetical protein [Massilia sp. ZL223]
MFYGIKTVKEALALMLRVWREAIVFFLSIELWLMVLVAGATVGGVWLAFTGDVRGMLALSLAAAYLLGRVVLHAKRILSWPFL